MSGAAIRRAPARPGTLFAVAGSRSGAMVAVLGLAAVLRLAVLWAAPGTLHPDEIYQYFEPAYRRLTGDGLVTWEWREGMRSWLLPTLIALPLGLGRALGGSLDLLLPRIAMVALSLTIVGSAWRLGAQRSKEAALIAAVTAATWYNLVYFAPRTLSEPIATALLFPAALWLADRDSDARRLAAAGALVAFAVMARPHYAPAAGVLVLVALGAQLPRTLLPVVAGGAAALALGGLVDWAQGQTPFAWMIENVRLNVVEDRAASYGTSPASFYLSHWLATWGWWTPAVVACVALGWRVSPALAAAAAVNLAVHSLIGHKEVRFVFLSEAVLVVFAGVGLAGLAARWKMSPLVAAAVAVVASVTIGSHGAEGGIWRTMRPGQLAFQALRHDPQACGLALVGAGFGEVPGRSHLPAGLPMAQFADRDPWVRDPRVAFTPYAPAFNRVFAPASAPPAGYRPVLCATDRYDRYCLWSRPGECAARPGVDNWDAGRVLLRSGR